jgi:hypothetical protein
MASTLTLGEVAARWGVKETTARSYVQRWPDSQTWKAPKTGYYKIPLSAVKAMDKARKSIKHGRPSKGEVK